MLPIEKFCQAWLGAINDSRDPDVDDIRNEQPEIKELHTHSGFFMYPDKAWAVTILKDQAYDVSSGYRLPCIDYTACEAEASALYEANPDGDDQVEGFTYLIKVKAAYYTADNTHRPEATPRAQVHLQMYVCLNGEYGSDYDPGFGSGTYQDMTRGGFDCVLYPKAGDVVAEDPDSLANKALAEFRKEKPNDRLKDQTPARYRGC